MGWKQLTVLRAIVYLRVVAEEVLAIVFVNLLGGDKFYILKTSRLHQGLPVSGIAN